jgi:glycosyltransferase involved in cell wall biosynthesis
VVFLLLGGTFDPLAEDYLIHYLHDSKVPYVASCSLNNKEDEPPSGSQAMLQMFYRNARATLFMSSHNQALLCTQLDMLIPRAQLIQNPLIITNDEALPWPPSAVRPQLGFVGRIDIEHKGLDLFLQAMARVRAECPFDFHLTGRCEDPASFAKLIDDLGLRDSVHVHGHAVGGDLLEAYGTAELVVLTSRWEGCASTMLEAMMAGRPQLVTAVGGVPDWLTDGDDAFIAEDVTVESIEHALLRALSSCNKWPEMGRAARRAFDAKRDPNPVGTLVGILEEAVGKRREAIGARLGA